MANQITLLSSFPTSPTNGQEISIDGRKWIYKTNIPGWICVQVGVGTGTGGGMTFIASETAPSVIAYKPGDRWFNTVTGIEYALINDGDDRYWVNVYVTPHSHSISNIVNLQTILDFKSQFYYRATPPSESNIGDRWMDSNTGDEFVRVYDGTSYQWVQPNLRPVFGILGATKIVNSSSYQLLSDDYYIGVNYAGSVSITLPDSPEAGRMVVIKDESGNASFSSRSISIYPYSASDTIDNKSSVTLNIDYGALNFIYRSGWHII